MESSETATPARKSRSVAMRVIDFLSSLGLATVCLLLLGVLTWLATLEQIHNGLYPTLTKYFDYRSPFIIPDLPALTINGKPLPVVLPGGYYVCALLLVNLTLGGVLRIRKGWKQVGVLISHFGIVFMLASAGVTDYYSQRGNMAVSEGETSDVARDYFEYVIEVAEVKTEKQEGIHVIRGKYLTDLKDEETRIFRLPTMPFDIEVTGYHDNAGPISVTQRAPQKGQQSFEGYYLVDKPKQEGGKAVEPELWTAACHARVLFRDGKKSDPFILAGASFEPYSIKVDDRVFTLDMRKRLWPMPFKVTLDKFTADFHPGTSRASKFISDITRTENGSEAKVRIEMNEPMRYEGLTFFQASYGPQGAGPKDRLYSVFEVVKNPADKWPEYSLYVVTFGLLVHFIMKLYGFLSGGSRKKSDVQ